MVDGGGDFPEKCMWGGGWCFGENVFSGGIEGCKTEKYTYQETSATLSLSSEFQKRS